MSMEYLFGSDLEDSEDEEKGKSHEKSAKNSQLNDLFGESGSEEEDQDGSHEKKDASEEESEDEKDNQESDNEQQEEQDESKEDGNAPQMSTKDLFGDEDISSEDEDKDETEQVQEQQQESDTNEEENKLREDQIAQDENLALGFIADEEEAEEEPENRLEVEIPYCRVNLGNELSFVKFPNFMSVDTKPFDPALYEDEVEDDEVLDDEGRARLKLRVENTIRWRHAVDKDGNEINESNARIVRWSDGTMSLMLGGEVFDVHKMKIEGDYNHLFVQQGTGLQGQAVFKDKLTFRPHSTNSQTHRKMTLSIADRVSKTQKIKMVPASGKDPESQRNELIKKEEERLRAQIRRESQQRRMRERSHAKGLSANYLEPDRYDEDEDNLEESLLAIKNKYKNRLKDLEVMSDAESDTAAGIFDGGLDSDEEDDDGSNKMTANESSQEESLSNTPSKRPSSELGGVKKKKRVITESDEDESE